MNRILIAHSGGSWHWPGPGAARAQMGPEQPERVRPEHVQPGGPALEPVLNLLRGGNNAVNYFYGVRPGTAAERLHGHVRDRRRRAAATFFPGADTLADLLEEPRDATR